MDGYKGDPYVLTVRFKAVVYGGYLALPEYWHIARLVPEQSAELPCQFAACLNST